MASNDSVQIFSDKYLENMGNVFKTLYTEEQLSDVTIHCRQGSIKAHKLILAANSPYFYRIFKENPKDHPIIILYGIGLNQLRNLMDLLYLGRVDVFNCDVEAVSSLVREFEIKGVVFASDVSNNVRLEINQGLTSPENAHNMHTRFKGQKRVAVDFLYEEEKSSNLSVNVDNKPAKRPNQEDIIVKNEIPSPVPIIEDNCSDSNIQEVTKNVTKQQDINAEIFKRKPIMEMSMPKLSAWAKKQRKFKCHLCPSSFKRSSHLSRHQLVHTGERPFACNQCDKAFSRHDKLKHHIRRAHEFIPDSMYERIDDEEINVENDESDNRMDVTEEKGRSDSRTDFLGQTSTSREYQRENSPLFTISHITSILEDSFVKPPKKGRGRPRKYPIVPTPTVKRGRGRPKLGQGVQNYDSSNLPYGDLNYLTRPSSAGTPTIDDVPVFLEPLVEIKTEQTETSSPSKNSNRNENDDAKNQKNYFMERVSIEPVVEDNASNEPSSPDDVDISEIETKIGLIGECTISVAN